MRFGSVCSGIEAASQAWLPLGWEAAWLSEIEPFPCSLLAHHYPDTPNFGDMTKFESWPHDDKHAIDLLCGGTPCQSFSVAGLRKGLDDPRGNLMLTFGSIAAKYRPKWLVWENVPGVLSSNGGKDFASFLDMLESIGYVCDCDIIDAQFHGVSQRRRRVFVCGQHRDDLIQTKTDTSALTIAQCLQEILHGILVGQSQAYEREPQSSELASLSKDGVKKRMRLFGMLGGVDCWPMLRMNLIESFQRFHVEQKSSDAVLGGLEKGRTLEDLLMGLKMDDRFILTEQLLKKSLDEGYEVMKSYITSTTTNSITALQIYTCSQTVLCIGRLTCLLNQSSPSFWSAASSSFLAIREYMSYARQTNDSLFGDMERFQPWSDFIKQAKCASAFIGNIGVESFGEIQLISHSLSGDSAPRRGKGEKIAPTVTIGPPFSRTGNSRVECDAIVASGKSTVDTLMANAGTKQWLGNQEAFTGDYHILQPAYAIQGSMIGPSDHAGPQGDGVNEEVCFTQNTTDKHAVAYGIPGNWIGRKPENGGNAVEPMHDVAPCLTKTDQHGVVAPIAWSEELTPTVDCASTMQRGGQGGRHEGVMTSAMQVRRLTLTECERLQGFPDFYTNVPHRGKPAADGPRYKALGNSWAVPCARWIGSGS